MKRQLKYFIAGSLCFLIFILFSYLVHKDLFTQADFNATVILQDHLARSIDGIFSLLSDIGVFEISLGFLLIILMSLKKIRGVVALAFFGLFHVIELYGKFFVEHLPPPEFMLRTEKIMDFPQFYVRTQNSYPSGHAGRTAFISLFLGLMILQNKKLSKLQKYLILGFLIIFDMAMFVSRVYLGEHWATDVVGGTLLGASLGILAVALY